MKVRLSFTPNTLPPVFPSAKPGKNNVHLQMLLKMKAETNFATFMAMLELAFLQLRTGKLSFEKVNLC